MSEPSFERDHFEEVAESFLTRYRAGERPSIAEYADRFPELAEQIHRLLPALVRMEQDFSVDADANAAPVVRDAPDGPSQRPGDYRILREIGGGGMGVVYEAEQVSLGRRVALKVLPRQVARDPKSLKRFRREARAAARLHHTNIVPVFEVGQDGETAYYAMQFIQGQGLDQVKNEKPARPRSLDGRIPRDLETIFLKAIGKDPRQCYASAKALAEDLGRFLLDEAIRARRASTAERYC